MKSESTATITSPGTEAYEALAVEVRALGRKHRLPEAFVAKTLDQLRDAVAMPPRLAAALIEQILAKVRTQVLAARKRRPASRGKYRTLERKRILAVIGVTPGSTTSEIARQTPTLNPDDPTQPASVSRQITHRSLKALQAEGLVSRHAKKDSRERGWYVTKAGTDLLDELPEVKTRKAQGYREILVLIEQRMKLRKELLDEEGWDWTYEMVRLVLPYHAASYIRRQMAEVKRLEKRDLVWSPIGVLWFRLGTEPMAMKKARIEAARLFTDPAARIAYVDAKREEAKRQVFEKRKQGIARLHLPPGLAQAYLEATKNEPFYIAVHLAFALRKMAKEGLTVTLGDLNGVLHQIRKEVQKRRRLPLDEDGEPRGPSPP